MESIYDKLTRLNVAIVSENGKITRINFEPFLRELYENNENRLIQTAPIIEFMASLRGKRKSSGSNGVSRLQTFLNAYLQETALETLNASLQFINNDHDFLERGGHGEDDSEFYFTASDGAIYKVEAKMYWNAASFKQNLPNTNFHNADYAIIFFLKDPDFRWAFVRKTDNYEKLYKVADLAESDPHLLEIKLPSKLLTISFAVDSKSLDADIPAEVRYRFYTN